MRAILHRESYHGVTVWNKTKKRDGVWGQKKPTDRPASEWVRVPAEELRIVPEALWLAAHGRLTERRANYARLRPEMPQEPLTGAGCGVTTS